MRRSTWTALLLALSGFEPLRRPNAEVDKGNDDYRNKRYEEAVQRYQRAKEALPDSAELHYDLGTALLALGKNDDAVRELREAARLGAGARAHYNLGNAHLLGGRAAEAIDSYRRSLRLDPRDSNAKWNLEMALRMKQEEEEKKQQQQSKDENQDPQQEQAPEQSEQQEGEDPQQQPAEDQNSDPQDAQDKPSESEPGSSGDEDEQTAPPATQQPPPATPSDQEQADQAVLDALERGEKNLQAQRLKALYRRRRVEKDW